MEKPVPSTEEIVASCSHPVLIPRWDNIGDMGKPERATGYKCDACSRNVTREEGLAALRDGAKIFGT
jgi:hypothetical protein